MKKLFVLPLIVILTCISFMSLKAQDSVPVRKTPQKPATYHLTTNPTGKPGIHTINKLVINVRNAYYPDKTPEEVAAIIYATPASYNAILDRIYNQYDSKKGISRDAFNASVISHYGNPFPSSTAKPVAVAPVTLKPVIVSHLPDSAKTTPAPLNPADKSLASQYQYLLTKVYNYQQPLIAAFRKNVMDTLKLVRNDLKTAQTKAAIQAKTIDSLQTAAKTVNQSLNEVTTNANAISLLGIEMPKGTYNLVMWGLVILFAAIAAIVISRSGIHTREAKYRTQLYNELDEEYKAYKAKANEKEKKLARELQTERNKLDDLLGKSDS
jgi:hypothetical protein